uniref:Arrestin_C domain-containing protein n=1 Tax=Syphacia muris TaxID=451379 RepID=A0A0N5ARD7_9BILA
MPTFVIVYDKPSMVYSPGETLSGTLQIALKKQLKVDSISVTFHGEAQTHFTSYETKFFTGRKRSQESYTGFIGYDGSKIYCDENQIVWSLSECKRYLTRGTYRRRFEFNIPLKCPPSYKGTYGSIQYYCYAKIDSYPKLGKKTKRFITVFPKYDLPRHSLPHPEAPIENTEKIGFFYYHHGYVHVKASIKKLGYAIGEAIDVCLDIANLSTKTIEKLRLRLKQIATYIGFCSYDFIPEQFFEIRTIASVDKAYVLEPKNSGVFYITTRVPYVTPSFDDCPLIKIRYELCIKVFVKGNTRNTLRILLPVVINTVPVQTPDKPLIRQHSSPALLGLGYCIAKDYCSMQSIYKCPQYGWSFIHNFTYAHLSAPYLIRIR